MNQKLEDLLYQLSRQEYEEMRVCEDRAESRMAEAIKLHPEQDIMVLSVTLTHFQHFRREVGPRPGKLEMVDRMGDNLRGIKAGGRWLLIELPGFRRLLHARPYNEREYLCRAIFSYNQKLR